MLQLEFFMGHGLFLRGRTLGLAGIDDVKGVLTLAADDNFASNLFLSLLLPIFVIIFISFHR